MGHAVNEDPIVSRFIADYNSKKVLQELGYTFDGESLSQIEAEAYMLITSGIQEGLTQKTKKGK